LLSALVGWWGVPFGLVITPVQIIRNLLGLLSSGPSLEPSAELEKRVRLAIAAQLVEESRQVEEGS
jgi:hypothetical protein